MYMHVVIRPINKLDNDLLNFLIGALSKEFDYANVTVSNTPKIDIEDFIDGRRNQIRSSELLYWVLEKMKPTREMKILIICDMDAYTGDLNFVFGEAYRGGGAAAIYLPRLRQEFYHLKPDELVFRDRIVKEAIHELGHSFGLYHCANKKCVMHFSNSLHDTDFKQGSFCSNCKNNIEYKD
jgi:archaemetzincin